VRVDFYTVGERFATRPLTLVCKLCQKALDAGFDVQVLCIDKAQARSLSEALWSFEPESFLPNALEDEDDASYAPIRLTVGVESLDAEIPYVLNLTTGSNPLPTGAYRLAEVVLLDEASKLAGRARFRAYRASGLDPKHHVL
jgi:DNA polymerase III subunit chi